MAASARNIGSSSVSVSGDELGGLGSDETGPCGGPGRRFLTLREKQETCPGRARMDEATCISRLWALSLRAPAPAEFARAQGEWVADFPL